MNRLLNLQRQIILADQINEDFLKYKNKSTINKEQFTKIVYGPNYEQRRKSLKIISNNPNLFEHYHITGADQDHQRYKSSMQVLTEIKKGLDIDSSVSKSNPNKFTLFGNGICFYDLTLTAKTGIHYSLYLKCLERLGTEKHKNIYQRACKFEDFGCFALTELSHGSNVRGILTEAHYDHQKRQIILNTPCKEGMKFWIGGAAKTCNMTVLWAQLYIKQECYGVHAFVVPLRDRKTHKVFPGITIGDCGPKQGLNGVDNGFILFDKFRIPVDNLLDKISGINQKGQFVSSVKSGSKRFGLTLAALSQGRLFMCCHSTTMGLSALAIAIRYSFIRRQFNKKQGQKQNLLIQYPLTKRRLMPIFAQQLIYMTVTMQTFLWAQNNEQKNELSEQNALLHEIHAVSSVLKAKTAWFSTEVIKQCRQMLGGHGFNTYSKLGILYADNDVNNTWEGDNHILVQQTAKYVLDNYQRYLKGKQIKSPLLKFLSNPPQESSITINKDMFVDFNKIIVFLQYKIVVKIQQMMNKMISLKQQGKHDTDIWNESQVYLGQGVSHATGDLYILTRCIEILNKIQQNQNRIVFKNILHLWVLLMLKNDAFISQDYHYILQTLIIQYSEAICPEALGLLEATTADDSVIGSPFADENGMGFEKYKNLILRHPTNQRPDFWKLLVK